MMQNIPKVNGEDSAVIKISSACGNLSTIFSSLRTKNAEELKLLSENICKLFEVNCELVNEVSTLREELGMHEIEKLFMADLLEKLEMDLSEFKNLNCRLKLELLSANDYLSEGEEELFDAEMKLAVVENLNSELQRAVDRMKKEYEESESIRENLEIVIQKKTEDNFKQNKNLQDMLEVKGNLEFELAMLSEEIKERRIREEYLSSELQEKQNEFELWDAEAATFCFDLQLSAIRELLFEDKVHELCGVCGSLQDENASKTKEIELLKEEVSFQSSEIRGLKSQIFPYSPAVDSIKEEVYSLEQNFHAWAKLDVANYQTPKDIESEFHAHEKMEDQDLHVLDEILELQKLQNRIKEVEKVVVEEMNRLERLESSRPAMKLEASVQDTLDLKSRGRSVRQKSKYKEDEKLEDDLKFQKTMPEILEVKNVILMKGFPLNQVSGGSLYGRSRRGNSLPAEQIRLCWETNEDNHRVDQNLIELQNQVYEPTKNVVYNDFEYVEHQSENPSSELDMEKELGVDKLQVSTTTSMPSRREQEKDIRETCF
ncbi:protein NETWORKED 1A-like [Apium graveolens]